jgi:hypothetical protein
MGEARLFEHRHEPLIPFPAFIRRIAKSLGLAFCIVATALAIGVMGYHSLANLSWVDSILNASMILSGMGPVNELRSTPAKLFASGYALFSGLILIVVGGIVIAPVLHRFFHWFHLDSSKKR